VERPEMPGSGTEMPGSGTEMPGSGTVVNGSSPTGRRTYSVWQETPGG
jgi:hypothetical protein